MLARLTAAIVPPAPEYVPKKRGIDSGEENNNNGDKGMELSVVVCPELENADAQITPIVSEYVSVALNMAIDEPKREDELDEREMEDSERILNKTDGSERFFSMSAVKKKFVWTIAKIDTKTARLRPLLLKGAKKIVSAIGREFARQFPPIESYVMENMLMRRAMEEEEMAIMNPDARRAFEESLLLGGKGVEEEEKKKTKDIEEVEEMVLEAPMVVVTSRKKVRNKLLCRQSNSRGGMEMNMNTENIEVANGGRITLPALNEEDKEFGMTAEIRTYIRQTIHHPNWIGWPTTEEFGKLGVLLQPLDDQTARALLVIDDEPALRFLATLQFA